ncbi:thioester reductase [Actinophytocola xinjiangensis]|uniref:Thioester reductase n=1 Tax=Actinophytocola xinjiangensis TaxID=485602 RepID=A0A7Z1AYF0_9PSEU|nr:non-ribosomal peptide synthetase [Actinophytocola xinjiangensis]OLF09657.1 thioester reductase [Actinophytocola xinjiangensis]
MQPATTITAEFARQVAARPDAVAVSAPDEKLTYRELDTRAERLARYLRTLGVGAETPVGVDLPRCAGLVVALLAVLKAGGFYLSLDPQQPERRRTLVLGDSGASVVITTELLSNAIGCDDSAPLPDAVAQSTAYLAYTSGSTGVPKGVRVPHRAVMRLVVGQELLPIQSDDVFVLLAPTAFDASTLELWGPLLNGGRLVVAPPHDLSPAEIGQLVRSEGVTTLWLTAGMFHAMVASMDAMRHLHVLRRFIAGGDVLSTAHVDRALRELPDTQLVNGYGPTENTTFTTCHLITERSGRGPVPIGRPITGTTVHLLDDELRPVPDGEAGELCTGGLGLANGYQNDPALTAARFVPDPFSATPGARLYRTGDLARRGHDGALDFLGRTDAQLKVRGFRVEPGEVETALRTHPEIHDAAVVARRPNGEQVLAAFYVSDQTMSTAELRTHLSALVPRYMVPSEFLHLGELPLGPTGKVDRELLTGTTMPSRPELSSDYRVPTSAREIWLARLWADLMQVDTVGVDDDFFELGGHSLLATQITVKIGEHFGRTVPAVTFYENPTVAELARVLGPESGDQ